MDVIKPIKQKLKALKIVLLQSSRKKKLILILICGMLIAASRMILFRSTTGEVTYETTKAEKGTLISSISGSGIISSGNNTNVTTKASGVVTEVYVTSGDNLVKGQKIAEISLDEYALERQTSAWVSYLDAQEAIKTAEKTKLETDLAMWKARDAIFDAVSAIEYKNNNTTNPETKEDYTDSEKAIIDKTLEVARASFAESELKYKNSDSEIASAQTKVASTLRNYQENSSTIYAPIEGIISDLNLAKGMTLNATSETSNTNGATIVSAQTVGKVSNPDGQLIASVSLSEIDIVKVKADQKVTLTLDAYEDKTFTGKVLSVDTTGTLESGVTSYSVKVILDPVSVEIYPNMAVNVEIITDIKSDVIMIPTSAITVSDDQSTVQVKKNGEISTVTVETGIANDTNTEIISGLNEGDEVVTATINPQIKNASTSTGTSPFSGIGGTNRGSGTGSRSSGGNMPGAGGPPGSF